MNALVFILLVVIGFLIYTVCVFYKEVARLREHPTFHFGFFPNAITLESNDGERKVRYLPDNDERVCENDSESGFLCSECSFGDFDGFNGYRPSYCPNCGAKVTPKCSEATSKVGEE